MLLSLRKNGLTSLFKEVRVFKVSPRHSERRVQDREARQGLFRERGWGDVARHPRDISEKQCDPFWRGTFPPRHSDRRVQDRRDRVFFGRGNRGM